MRVRKSDYCGRCGALMEPDGMIGRSQSTAGLCVECEDDDTVDEIHLTPGIP